MDIEFICVFICMWFFMVFLCITDELFGQCLAQQEGRFRYRVTAALLDRLQSLLQMLMKEGQSYAHTLS